MSSRNPGVRNVGWLIGTIPSHHDRVRMSAVVENIYIPLVECSEMVISDWSKAHPLFLSFELEIFFDQPWDAGTAIPYQFISLLIADIYH